MIELVISGGQTGADMAGLLAARACGIATGGTAPKGWRTELGSNLMLKHFGLVEHESDSYPLRTEENVRAADLTLIVATDLDGGSKLTSRLCVKHRKPMIHVKWPLKDAIVLIELLREYQPKIVNVAGNRESKTRGIELATTKYLTKVFRAING